MSVTSPAPSTLSKPRSSRKWFLWGAITLVAVLILQSLFVVFRPDIAFSENTISSIATVTEISDLTPDDVAALLLRNGSGSNGMELDILYAPVWFYAWNQRSLPQTDVPVLAFFVMETIHEGALEEAIPVPLLQVGDSRIEPLAAEIVSDAPHHRVSQLLYPAQDEMGEPLITDKSEQIVLVAPIDGEVFASNTFTWALPLPHGLGALNVPEAQSEVPAAPTTGPHLSWPAFLAIMGGMLTALSPCLLQLAVYYSAVLAGVGSEQGQLRHARRHLVGTGLFFVAGFTLIYTTGGAIAGYVGDSLQQLGFLQQWYRPISVIAGVVIILLALRVAIQAKAPLVCKLPFRVKTGNKPTLASAALMGSTFAVGCLTCFGATVLSAMLVYAGSTGSTLIGASLMLQFSAGVGIVFVLAALLIGQAAPFMEWLHRYQPIIGGISALVMAVFGLLMITYRFHIVSGLLFRLFSIG